MDFPQLIRGSADFVVYARSQPWDHAPGSLLLTEAGGHVGTLDGHDYDPRQPGQGRRNNRHCSTVGRRKWPAARFR